MYFGVALNGVTMGERWTRTAWWPEEFIFLVPGSTFRVSREPLLGILGEGVEVQYRAHIDKILSDGSIGVYTASNEDLLATDWREFRANGSR